MERNRKWRAVLLAVAAFVALPALVHAGVEKGKAAPALMLPGSDGGDHDLEALSAEGPVVVVFFRGGW